VYEMWPMMRLSDVAKTRDVPAVTMSEATRSEPVPSAPPPTVETKSEQTPATAATASTEVRVRLEFSEPSWAEIYDSTGKRLMFDMGTPGRTRSVAGVPPLRVSLGLASAVSAQVDDRPIVIPRRAGKDAAKFLIEADGAVRPDFSSKTAERE